jgi:putative SOS response-associated peptidase YedK
MCGRMTLARDDFDEVAEELEALYTPAIAAAYRPRYNVAPTDTHVIVRATEYAGQGSDGSDGGGRSRWLQLGSWGFFGGPKRPPLINARAETAAGRGSFASAFAERRCVVPADGFYEWSGPKEARQPHWLHRADGGLLLFAGLWQEGAPGSALVRFTVLTCAPNQLMSGIHDRMPVILAPGDVTAWLAKGDPALLRPAPEDVLRAVPVSTRVNSVKNDDPACLTPLSAAAPRPGQLRLF